MRISMSGVWPSGIPFAGMSPGVVLSGLSGIGGSPAFATPAEASAAGYNPAQYLDADAAQKLAEQLGGTLTSTVVTGPIGPPPQAIIDLGGGLVVNAGLANQLFTLYGPDQAKAMLAASASEAASPSSVWGTAVAAQPAGNMNPSLSEFGAPSATPASPVLAPIVQAANAAQAQAPAQAPATVQGSSTGKTPGNSGAAAPPAVTANWFTQTSVGSIPNWAWIAGVVGAFALFTKGLK